MEMTEDIDYPIAHQLATAIENGDLPTTKRMIEEDQARLKWVTFLGSWLHQAAYYNQTEIAKYLIEAGIPLECEPEESLGTPLNMAARLGSTEVARLLLDQGAKMDVSDPVKNPLFSAALEGSTEIVQLLLDHGIDATVRYTGERMKNMSVVEFADRQGQHAVRDQVRAFLARKAESEEAIGRTA